jgi:hypothetical protein
MAGVLERSKQAAAASLHVCTEAFRGTRAALTNASFCFFGVA